MFKHAIKDQERDQSLASEETLHEQKEQNIQVDNKSDSVIICVPSIHTPNDRVPLGSSASLVVRHT